MSEPASLRSSFRALVREKELWLLQSLSTVFEGPHGVAHSERGTTG